MKTYAQLNENNICFAVSTFDTGIEATSDNIGQRYNNEIWEEVEKPVVPQPHEPTNAEVAQMISDLKADLIIAGVI